MSTETNATTAHHATETEMLPLTRVHLIGIAGANGAHRALLRRRNGEVNVVVLGDETAFGTVVAIDASTVVLSGNTGTRILRMPTDDTDNRSAA